MKKQLNPEQPKKIKLGMYPYTFARVSAMKAKLINRSEYHKLLKMSINQITEFLEEYEYKESIDRLASHFKGIELIERALIENLVQTFDKLKRISSDDLDFMINSYLSRWDFTNIKTILRGRFSNADKSYIKSLLVPLGTLSREFLESLVELSPEEIIGKFRLLDEATQKTIIKRLKETDNLMIIENLLDKHYYSRIIKISEAIVKSSFIKDYLKNEIDIVNIKLLFKLKKANVNKEKIKGFLLFTGHLDKDRLNALAEAEDIEHLRKKLMKTRYKEIVIKEVKDSLIEIELTLERYLVQKSILAWHKHPVSAMAILSYMFAKEIEVNNLNSIIRGKQLGLSDDFIENNLVVI